MKSFIFALLNTRLCPGNVPVVNWKCCLFSYLWQEQQLGGKWKKTVYLVRAAVCIEAEQTRRSKNPYTTQTQSESRTITVPGENLGYVSHNLTGYMKTGVANVTLSIGL